MLSNGAGIALPQTEMNTFAFVGVGLLIVTSLAQRRQALRHIDWIAGILLLPVSSCNQIVYHQFFFSGHHAVQLPLASVTAPK